MYYFVRKEKIGEETDPKLPKNTGFLLLAEAGNGSKYSLYECDLTKKDKEINNKNIKPVGAELKILLDSAKYFYPPALALARNTVLKKLRDIDEVSVSLFESELITLLDNHLRDQKKSKFFLSKAIVDEIGYLSKGSYYWVVHYCPNKKLVYWVSSDYFIYFNQIQDFELDLEFIEKQFSDD